MGHVTAQLGTILSQKQVDCSRVNLSDRCWEFLWNTLKEFPRFPLRNLRWKSPAISSDQQRLVEVVFVVQL